MEPLYFVTGSDSRLAEIRKLLGDVVVERVDNPANTVAATGLDLETGARNEAADAFRRLGSACFVDRSEIVVAGDVRLRGREFRTQLDELGAAGLCERWRGRDVVVRLAVALATRSSPDDVRVFSAEMVGCIAAAPHGESGHGWDRILIPDGHDRTLAELDGAKFVANVRWSPYLDLADHVRGRSYRGAFEAHVTVRCSAGELARFSAVCDALGAKSILIELPTGEHLSQPMTSTVHRGTLRAVQDEVGDLARALLAEHFDVVRVKIEALPRNADLPETDDEAARLPGCYFEYHWKLEIPPDVSIAEIAAACATHDGRLSRNARRMREDGAQERFVTLRVHDAGRGSAESRFGALDRTLAALPIAIKRRVREFTVYDSNLDLDRGW